MRLADPLCLALALLVVPLWWNYRRRPAAVRFPSLGVLAGVRPSPLARLRHLPFALRCLAVLALALALARPQAGSTLTTRTSEGLDIMLVIDTSGSMNARDYVIAGERKTRIAVVKEVTAEFIRQRTNDRIGMVIFGSEAFTQAPLTFDHDVLAGFMERIQIGVAGDATAIGDGLATAVNRLKTVDAKSRIVVLLTDGGNNAGRVDPLAAAEAAKTLGIKVYTIGFGSDNKEVEIEVNGQVQLMQADLDESLCKEIAKVTGGSYFRAADTETLVAVYDTIDQLEKTKVTLDSFASYEERYLPFAALAALALLGELGLSLTRLRRVP